MYIMSGVPVNTQQDIKKVRDNYLANLRLQIANENKNLQANLLYKRTGQTSQLPDTRTTSEKLQDINMLKTMVNQELLKIMDGSNDTQVVNTITTPELQFLAQHIKVI